MLRNPLLSCLAVTAMLTLSGCTQPQWRLGVQAYTFRQFTLFETIDKTKALNLRYLEGITWQKIGAEAPQADLLGASDSVLDAVKRKLDQAGVQMPTCYCNLKGTSEADDRKAFALAKRLGVETLVCEPPAAALERLDRMAEEYGVNLAIHNHPQGPGRPQYVNWNPDEVVKMLAGRSRRIGTCPDTGHWTRSGVDPVEALKKYQGRVMCVHVKDVVAKTHDARDVVWGTGIGNVRGVLTELARQKFTGVIAIEYEDKPEDNVNDVAACVRYFTEATRSLRGWGL